MIYTDDYIFVHPPKTGGDSIHKALGGRTKNIPHHAPLWWLEENGDPIGERKAWGFVRDPWERAVSYWRFSVERHNATSSFKEWLLHTDVRLAYDSKFHCEVPVHHRPQLWWLSGCDYIGRFEHLNADYEWICGELKIKAPTLPHLNRTEGPDWRLEYDNETLDFINLTFESDINYFEFKAPELADARDNHV